MRVWLMNLKNLCGLYSETIIVILLILSLYLTSLESYLLFHSIVELVSIIVIVAVFFNHMELKEIPEEFISSVYRNKFLLCSMD